MKQLFTHTILQRIEPLSGINRWYSVTIQPTLLDEIAVVCRWGSRENDYQQAQIHEVASYSIANGLAIEFVNAKLKQAIALWGRGVSNEIEPYRIRATEAAY